MSLLDFEAQSRDYDISNGFGKQAGVDEQFRSLTESRNRPSERPAGVVLSAAAKYVLSGKKVGITPDSREPVAATEESLAAINGHLAFRKGRKRLDSNPYPLGSTTARAFDEAFIAARTEAAASPPSPVYHYEATATPLPDVKWTQLPQGTRHDYEVKSWPWFFEPMIAGEKKHDMRDKSERGYTIGDRVLLREFDPRGVGYTGRAAVAVITYITSNDTPCAMSSNALAKDACILSVMVGPAFEYAGSDA